MVYTICHSFFFHPVNCKREFFLIFKTFILCILMFVYMYVHHVCASYLWRSKEAAVPLELVTDNCKLPLEC